MAEVKIALLPTGMTYSRNTKAPLEDKRIFTTLALAQEYVNNVDQTAYVGLTISVVNDGANNGLYYVERIADADNASGFLSKIGSDTASDVANLQLDVAALKSAVGDSTSGLVADVAGKADAFTAGDGINYTANVVKVAISATEGNSLSVNSDGLYVAVPKIEVPEYTLETVSNSDSAYASQYQLKKDGVAVGATINIPKDQFLQNAEFVASLSVEDAATYGLESGNPYLKFTWQLDTDSTLEGDQKITFVPVSDLVDTYTAGEYITITNNVIDVNYAKVALNLTETWRLPEKWAAIEANTAAIGNSSNGLVADVAGLQIGLNNLGESVSTLSTNVTAQFEANATQFQTINTEINGIKATLADCGVRGVDTTATHGISLSLVDPNAEDDDTTATHVKVNVDLDTLAAAVIAKHDVPAPVASNIAVSAFGTTYTEDTNVQTVLESLDSRIKAAVSGGVTSVVNGFGISVTATDVNNPTVSVKTSDLVVAGSALTVNADNKIDLV